MTLTRRLGDFPGVDPTEIIGIVISAGPAVGAFELWVDGVILR